MNLQDFIKTVRNIESIPPPQLGPAIQTLSQSLTEFHNPQHLSEALFTAANSFMKLKTTNLYYYVTTQKLLNEVIDIVLKQKLKIGAEAIRQIFIPEQQYYKSYRVEKNLQLPLGKDRPLEVYQPKIAEQCDIIKPHITSTSICGWTRCTYFGREENQYLIQYYNTPTPIKLKEKPFFAPLGSRTLDFDWRTKLDIGNKIDAMDNKATWRHSTILNVENQNQTKKVLVGFRIFDKQGDKIDQKGNAYIGLGSTEDEWFDITSPRIQMQGKMQKKGTKSIIFSELIIDDHYDILFEKQYRQKQFNGIMRMNFCRSLAFLDFYNRFVDGGGLVFIEQSFQNPEYPIKIPFINIVTLANASFIVPRMGVSMLEPAYNEFQSFLNKNLKILNHSYTEMSFYFLTVVGKRIMAIQERQKILHRFRKTTIPILLKQNLEKKLLAIRMLYDLLNPIVVPYSEEEKIELFQFCKETNIFSAIYQSGVHDQILFRSVGLMKTLLDMKVVGLQQLLFLWNLVPLSDVKNRQIMERFFAELVKSINIELVQKIVEKILNLKETEITIYNLNILREVKNRQQLKLQSRLAICYYLWELITVKAVNISRNIQEEAEIVFKGVLPTWKDLQIKFTLLKMMSKRFQEIKILKNQIGLIKDFMLTYPKKIPDTSMLIEGVPSTLNEVVKEVKKQDIYDTLIRLFKETKNQSKRPEILYFMKFLFDEDSDDIKINQLVKSIYQVTGPTQLFMAWSQKISERIIDFFTQILDAKDTNSFANLSINGFNSLKNIVLNVNSYLKNLRVSKIGVNKWVAESQSQGPVVGPSPGPVTVATGPSMPLQKTNKNQVEMKTFINVLTSPFNIKGMKLLQQLMVVAKQSKIQEEAVKFMISLFVNLDQSLKSETYQIRYEFLMSIMQSMEKLNEFTMFNSSAYAKLQAFINLIQSIFLTTEEHGLGQIKPHIQHVVGDVYNLKIENAFKSPEQKLQIDMNSNATIWTLKKKIAQIIEINPNNFDIYKYQYPLPGESNGKTINDVLFTGQGIKVGKKKSAAIPKEQLLDQSNTKLSIKFDKIVELWYDEYKNHSKGIGIEELKRLSGEKWKGTFLKQVQKLNTMMAKYDKGSKGYLTLQEFKQQFIDKVKQATPAVWRILNLSGYKNDLRLSDDKYIETEFDEKILPRKILSNEKVYQILYNLLGNKAFQCLHTNIYQLLSQLETDKKIKEILLSGGYLDIQDAGPYKLSYYLDLINWLMSEDPKQFYEQFIKNDGCIKLLKALHQITKNEEKSIYEYDTLLKEFVIPNILKTLNMYYVPFHLQKPIMALVVSTKINSTQLDTMINKLWIQNYSEKKEQFDDKLLEQKQIVMNHISKIDIGGIRVLGLSIFKNLSKNYKNSGLPKITNEISKIVSCCVADSTLDAEQFISCVKSQQYEVRRIASIVLYLNSIQYPEKLKRVLNCIMKQIPKQSNYIYSDFFTLFKRILQKALEKATDIDIDIDFTEIAQCLLVQLLAYEQNQKCDVVIGDKLLIGILVCLNIVLQKKADTCKKLVKYQSQLLSKCLFFYGAKDRIQQTQINQDLLMSNQDKQIFPDYIKCKSDDARKILYEIIEALYSQSFQEQPKFYSKYIMPIIQELKEPRKIGYKVMRVGLYNYGSTCYANAMIQVLNVISPFRNGIMMSEVQNPLIFELKRMLAFLFFSQRVDYAPRAFFQSFSQPIHTGLQQDTTEFLNFLFDNLQRCLKNSTCQNLLSQVFKGSTVAQMICHSCGAKRERKQEFFTYDVDIDGKYDLKSALEGMLQGEVISDCLCQTCNTKSDTTKRSLINQIPNVFFLHLRRIVFNYDVFTNNKIHTRLQFPQQLNIEPFTKEGVDLREKLGIQYLKNLENNQEEKNKFQGLAEHGKIKDYYKLKLKGVIIHSGSGNAGHYFALVDEGKSWIKLNDSRVQSFSMYNLQSQCFGGTWSNEEWGGGISSSSNAYVLIYERIHKDSIVIGKDQQQKIIPYNEFKTFNIPAAFREVWLDNHQLLLQTLLLSEAYCKDFIKFTNSILKNSPQQDKIYIVSELILKVCVHANYVGQLQQTFMKNLDQIREETLRKYILADKKRTFRILIHQDKKVRNFYSTYIQQILIANYRNGDEDLRKQIIAFLQENLAELHNELSKNWLYCGAYFKMFHEILSKSVQFPQLYHIFLKKDFISRWIDFVMEKASPIAISHKKYSLGNKANPIEFHYGISSIQFLVKRSYGFSGTNNTPKITEQQTFHLSNNATHCLSSLDFYEKMMRQRQNLTSLAQIIKILSFQNLPFSEGISRAFLKIICQITDVKDKMIDISYLLGQILSIKDQYQIHRIEAILGFASPYIMQPNILTSLQEDKFVYQSSLENLFPIESLFSFIVLNKTRNPVAITYLIAAALKGCLSSEEGILYLISQPGPSLLHRNIIEWIKPFIDTVVVTSGMDKKKKEKREYFEKEVETVKQYLAKLDQFTIANKDQIPRPIIIGDFKQKKIVKSFTTNNLSVVCHEVIVFGLQFKHFYDQKEHLSQFIRENKLIKPVHPSSNILRIFKPNKVNAGGKQKTKSPSQMQIQKIADSMFDDDNSKKEKEPMQIEQKICQQANQNQDEQLELVNILKLSTFNYYYEIEIENKGHQTKNVFIFFNKKLKANTYLPIHDVLQIASKRTDSCWLAKRNPIKDWGNIEFNVVEKEVKAKQKAKDWFRVYDLKEQQMVESMEVEPVFVPPQSTEKQCPVCTFLNSGERKNCEMCQTPLM